jgi:ATP-dependent DNA ligase
VKTKADIVEPMHSLAVGKLPEGPAWSYELKFDGHRALGLRTDGKVQLFSRNGKDFTKRFASISSALEKLPDETVVDGEIVAYDPEGRPSFNVLQSQRSGGRELQFYLFHLLTLRGKDQTQHSLTKRREFLHT